jgi:hypothetical protein
MNSDPLVSARMREIQNSAAARRKKREDAAEELDRRKAKAEAERRQQVSPRDVEAQEKIDAAKRHRVWFDQMQSCKTEFYDPTTSPFRRGQCVILYAEGYRHVNGMTIAPQEVINLWEGQRRQEKQREVQARLRAAAGMK